MTKPFKGTINIDDRDSVPDWEPYVQPVAPEGAPNVLYIVLDDVGFSAMEPWGGLIETPNINRLAETRPHLHELAHDGAVLADPLVAADRAQPHDQRHGLHRGGDDAASRTSNGHIPFECATIAEVLGERGWNTYMLGKWHLVRRRRDEHGVDEAQLAGRPRLRALLRVPRRRDEPVVSGPRLRQPPGRAAGDARRTATTSRPT